MTIRQRIGAWAVFIAVVGLFGLLWAGGAGRVDMSRLFGICGFKQSTGYPCPGCGITSSAMAFARGRIWESFYTQPAGAVFCCLLVIMAIFALLVGGFGVNFGFLHRSMSWRGIMNVIGLVLVTLAGGWAVTLARAITENIRP